MPYDLVYCDIKRRSGKGAADPNNPHPEKRVPALRHGSELVTEQAAIALYLTDSFPQSGFGRAQGEAGRAAYLSWLAFFAGEADPVYNARLLYGALLDPMTLRDQARVAERVDAALATGPFLMGERCSAADLLMSGPFGWDPELASGRPRIADWLQRLEQLPPLLRRAAMPLAQRVVEAALLGIAEQEGDLGQAQRGVAQVLVGQLAAGRVQQGLEAGAGLRQAALQGAG